jgi:hypothetical protein
MAGFKYWKTITDDAMLRLLEAINVRYNFESVAR